MSEKTEELRDKIAIDAMKFFLDAAEKRSSVVNIQIIAASAYALADAMLAAREK